ncbi:MAG: peptide deformylase [Ectothiorhodospiraceae bacterium]|nr:peptide deformylase [Ectothiorhodospiraceae bacterium]
MDILQYPDERLKQVSEAVEDFNDELQTFAAQLEITMCAGPGGVGIAAPQVGRFQRIVIVDISGMRKIPAKSTNNGRMILINPEITEWEGMAMGREGCMSVLDFTGNVIRAEKISVTAFDELGEQHEYHCEGYEARAVQHEVDHLDGLLFLDRLVSRRTDLFKRKVYKGRAETRTKGKG